MPTCLTTELYLTESRSASHRLFPPPCQKCCPCVGLEGKRQFGRVFIAYLLPLTRLREAKWQAIMAQHVSAFTFPISLSTDLCQFLKKNQIQFFLCPYSAIPEVLMINKYALQGTVCWFSKQNQVYTKFTFLYISVYVYICGYVYEVLDKQLYSTRGNIYRPASLRHKLCTVSLPMQPPWCRF